MKNVDYSKMTLKELELEREKINKSMDRDLILMGILSSLIFILAMYKLFSPFI